MKKTLLLTAIVFTINVASINAQIVNIPNANFKTYLVGNTAINTNSDSEIQLSEANSFNGNIVCTGLNITDLTGIETFTALTFLNCSNNLLTNLNVASNTSINYLNCSDNQLTTLNLTANTLLKDLDCRMNQITSLNLSANLLLETLACSNNQLTTLNLSSNTVLLYLVCYSNLLTSLNVQNTNNSNFTFFGTLNNPSLTCIQVDNVAYSATNWTNVDPVASFNTNCSLSTSIIDNNIDNDIIVYPNPSTGIISLSNNYNVKLTDINGRIIVSQENTNSFDFSKESSGIYFLTLSDTNGKLVYRNKIVKE